MNKDRLLWRLFVSTFMLSAFTFGGGYVIVSLMKKRFVDEYHWLEEEEMLDLTAIAQSSPGPIALNAAIAVGYKLSGLKGALIAVAGTVLPPFLVIGALSVCYATLKNVRVIALLLQGMQAGVAAVIVSVCYDMAKGIVKSKDPMKMFLMIAAFVMNACFGVSAIVIIMCCAAVGIVHTQAIKKGGEKA